MKVQTRANVAVDYRIQIPKFVLVDLRASQLYRWPNPLLIRCRLKIAPSRPCAATLLRFRGVGRYTLFTENATKFRLRYKNHGAR